MGLTKEARRKAEFDHGASQEALASAGEACKKAEEENSHLAEEKLTLVIELGAIKDDFAAFREKVAADREMMEAEFDSSDDTLFNYSMLNPSVPLTAAFFANPRCPLSASAAASSVDPVVVSEEDLSANSPSAAREEVVLPTEPEEAVIVTDPLAE